MTGGNDVASLAEEEKEMTLLELLDRLLDKGIVIYGDVMISIADIDLIYLGLRIVIGSVDAITRENNPGSESI